MPRNSILIKPGWRSRAPIQSAAGGNSQSLLLSSIFDRFSSIMPFSSRNLDHDLRIQDQDFVRSNSASHRVSSLHQYCTVLLPPFTNKDTILYRTVPYCSGS